MPSSNPKRKPVTCISAPRKPGGEWKWREFECESHAEKLRKKFSNDDLNDMAILCSDGKKVRCCKVMLIVASEVFSDMLAGEELEKSNDNEDCILVTDRFTSGVVQRVVYYCHTGQLLSASALSSRELLDLIVAADFYQIDELGGKALTRMKTRIDRIPNTAFYVASKFGLDHKEESRTLMASAMYYARSTIEQFEAQQLEHSTIGAIASLQERDTLSAVLGVIDIRPKKPKDRSLLKLQFLEKWVELSGSDTEVAQELVEEKGLLKEIGFFRPFHLIDKTGWIRKSKIVSPASLMEAIYDIPSDYTFQWIIET